MEDARHDIREQWEFRREQGRWRWRWRHRDGHVLSASTRTFATLNEAIEDARRNGFAASALRG